MSRIFEVDYYKRVVLLIPPRLRAAKYIGWLNGLCTAIVFVYQNFRRNRDANLYRLKITPQVCYLERLLNDRYDISARRIKIIDSVLHDPIYIFLEAENKPVFIYPEADNKPVYVFTDAETAIDPVDFMVIVPAAVQFNESEFRVVLDSYKLASKKYSIIIA